MVAVGVLTIVWTAKDHVLTSKLRLIESPPEDPATRRQQGEFATARFRSEIFELVYRQMHALAGRSRDLDDLVQMAAEQVLRSLARFEERCAPATWTYRICYHTLLKQRRWYHRFSQRFIYEKDASAFETADRSAATGADSFERRERASRLRKALECISPKRRAVVIMHDLEELEIEEIAVIVDANVHTVRSRLRDGRRMLAQALHQDPYFGDEACRREDSP